MFRPVPLAATVLCACAIGAGCGREAGEDLVVACCWSGPERASLEADFRAWLAAGPDAPRDAPRVRWVAFDVNAGPPGASPWARAPDLVVGGPPEAHDVWVKDGRIAGEQVASRVVVRERSFGLVLAGAEAAPPGPITLDELAGPKWRGRLALADPRTHAPALALAAGCLDEYGWERGFAVLARLHDNAVAVVRGDPAAVVGRGRAQAAIVPGGMDGPLALPIAYRECASLARDPAHPEVARSFLGFLKERLPGPADLPAPPASGPVRLLADFLGATLVDRHGDGHLADGGGLSLPPWPPESLAALRDRDESGDLVRVLAEQIVADAEARAWLQASWDELGTFDGERWRALAQRGRGTLPREPRLRAWLIADWDEWSRTRRRPAREARP